MAVFAKTYLPVMPIPSKRHQVHTFPPYFHKVKVHLSLCTDFITASYIHSLHAGSHVFSPKSVKS